MSETFAVGIDLGTTYSAIAYINQHGKPEIIPNREGDRVTPSVVLFDGDAPVVGTLAKRSAVARPLNICQFVKRQMGERDWRFVAENDKEYTAEAISALILRRLIEDAQMKLNCTIREAVLTVPAYFNDAQRKATQDAGRIAGLEMVRLINEPTAAALAYGLHQDKQEVVMVYDLGGGTFDVTIMRLAEGDMTVLATGGDKNLGGFDWDNKLMVFLNEQFGQAGGADLFDDVILLQDLRDKTEIAKKTLSTIDQARVFLSAAGTTKSIDISRGQFEELSADLLKRTEGLMTMTLEDAKLAWSQIDKVLLVGGSTRMKSVPALLEAVSGKKPSFELHPDEVVATGAAVRAGIALKVAPEPTPSNLDGLPSITIADVNSHSLGVVALTNEEDRMYNSIILAKDTAYGTRKSRIYGTVVDNQRAIQLDITEGEEENIEYVRTIGKGTIDIPPYQKGAPVEVFFEYNDDGMIVVTVYDKTAGREIGNLRIQRESNRSLKEIEEMKREINTIKVQ